MTYRSRFRLPDARFASPVRRSLLAAAVLGLMATGCATKGTTVATPRPFPGATVPPRQAPRVASADPLPDSAAVDPIIALALSLQGTPYRNGGSDPSGFDCSGFVQWVFARQGLALPREVRQQYLAGSDIDENDVQPGDLVFFETVADGASHVGIALGGGEFVHAPSSRGVVRVERYTSRYWAERWVGARRISGSRSPVLAGASGSS